MNNTINFIYILIYEYRNRIIYTHIYYQYTNKLVHKVFRIKTAIFYCKINIKNYSITCYLKSSLFWLFSFNYFIIIHKNINRLKIN